MRTTIILSLGALMILSACSTKLSLVKRRYANGYYVSVTKKPAEKKAADPRLTYAAPQNEIRYGVRQSSIANEIMAPANATSLPSLMQANKRAKETKSTGQPLLASVNHQLPGEQPAFVPLVHVKKISKPKDTGELDFIIMVILCFFPFINLIPVYLHDNRAITLNFWITLILDCVLFVPGIIFALLVILNMVDIH
jgi:hypothetical protein